MQLPVFLLVVLHHHSEPSPSPPCVTKKFCQVDAPQKILVRGFPGFALLTPPPPPPPPPPHPPQPLAPPPLLYKKSSVKALKSYLPIIPKVIALIMHFLNSFFLPGKQARSHYSIIFLGMISQQIFCIDQHFL